MSSDFSARLDRHFASLTDPRRGKVTYPLINIVAIALCATIAGADDFVAIADWARQKKDWLAKFLDLSSGGLPPKSWSSLNGSRTTGREPGSDPCENDPDQIRLSRSFVRSRPTSTRD